MRATGVATLAGGALALSALAGCARPPEVYGLRHDPTFTPRSLDSGRIAVGGVTSIADDTAHSPSLRVGYESLLISSLREARPLLQVAPAGAVAAEFGDKAHGELLDRYGQLGELDSASLHEMSGRLPKLRYVVFARIDADVIDSAKTVTLDSSQNEHTELSRWRTMSVGFQVYDMSLRRSVWSGQFTQREDASNKYDEPRTLLGAVVSAVLDTREYPAAPAQHKILRPIFAAFAGSLPQSSKRRM
jgi:hypothetical protein